MRHLLSPILLSLLPAAALGAAPPVHIDQTAKDFLLSNGIVSLTLNKKSAELTSMTYAPEGTPTELGARGPRCFYWDENAVPLHPAPDLKLPAAGYTRPFQSLNAISILTDTPEMADIRVDFGPSDLFPFHCQFHYLLRRGIPGFYTYALFQHGPGMPAATLDQTRCVIRAENKGRLFTAQFADDSRKNLPISIPIAGTLQDATYRLTDGSAYTKYDNTQFMKDITAYGMAGHHVGLWFVWPSTEFCNGGPLKQELTVQTDNIMQAMFQGRHFGAAPITVQKDETWSKCVGPVLIYMNHADDNDALWTDAKQQAADQQKRWPYTWLHTEDYPLHRGTVTGEIQLDSPDKPDWPAAWVILASNEPGEANTDWAMRSKGYQFWTHPDAAGHFSLPNVRPGNYTLFVSGADQFEDFQKSPITVEADHTTQLGELHWSPITHGKTLWQIGTPDRSTAEFHDGQQPIYRNYDAFLDYFKTFPHDITFTIGQSTEAKDWEYAQWSWYNEHPDWTIRFTLTPDQLPPNGTATLTLGIAAAFPRGDILIRANNHPIAKFPLPRTGTATYRSGAQDSQYTVKYLPFDATLLHPGQNEITLTQSGMQKFTPELLKKEKRPRAIMYDALRLELNSDPPPSDQQHRNAQRQQRQ